MSFGAINQFQVSHHGIAPSETRIGFIIPSIIVNCTEMRQLGYKLPVLGGICAIALLHYVPQS